MKILITLICFFAVFVQNAHCYDLNVTPPTTNLPSTPATDLLNTTMANETAALKINADTVLEKYGYTPDLTTGFANANVYSAHAASQRFAPGKNIVITAGTMLGAHAPSADMSYYSDFDSDIELGDIEGGVALNPIVLQAGMKADYLLEGLFVSVKLGKLSMELDQPDLNLTSDVFNFGVMASYPILKGIAAPAGLVAWKGLSLNSGIIYQSNNIKFNKTLDDIRSSVNISYLTYTGYVTLDPSIEIDVDTYALIFPVELVTTVKIMSIHLTAGAGIDFCTGDSKVSFNTTGGVNLDGSLSAVTVPGTITIDASTDGDGPNTLRSKLMFDIGLNMGPAMLDIPFSWYPSKGASIGLTCGIQI